MKERAFGRMRNQKVTDVLGPGLFMSENSNQAQQSQFGWFKAGSGGESECRGSQRNGSLGLSLHSDQGVEALEASHWQCQHASQLTFPAGGGEHALVVLSLMRQTFGETRRYTNWVSPTSGLSRHDLDLRALIHSRYGDAIQFCPPFS